MRRGLAGSLAPTVAALAAAAVHVLAALHLDARAPTDGEARLAAGVYAAGGGAVGPVPLPLPDLLAARQLAAVTAPLPGSWSVWETAQAGALVFGLLTAVLLWPVLRRLGCGGGPTALGVTLVGVAPPAVALHSSVTAAAVGVPWLLLAAVLAGRGWLRRGAAALAMLVAVVTAPLVGAAVLALATHAVVEGTLSRTWGRARRVAAGLVVGAAAVAVAVAVSGDRPLAGVAAPPLPHGAAVTVAVIGIVLVAAGWSVRWVRPLLSPTVLLLVALLAPGPGRLAAALAVLPFLATVLAAVAEEVAVRVGTRALWPVPVVATGAALVATVLLLPVPGRAPASGPSTVMSWMDEQMPGATLHADALDRAELIEAGFPAARLRELGAPVSSNDAVLLGARPGAAPAGTCSTGELRATLPWWGGARAQLCGAADPVTSDETEQAGRVRVGTALAGNHGLQRGPSATDLLTTGRVDPRLMIVLSVLASSHTLVISDFPTAPYEPGDVLRRQVLLTSVDGLPAASGPTFLRDWLDGQHAPFVPAVVRVEDGGLMVGYRAPTPAGLLPG